MERIGLCVFGIAYSCGFAWKGTPKENPRPLTAEDVVRLAAENGLRWVEMPARMLGRGEELLATRRLAESLGVGFILGGGLAHAEALRDELQVAAALGAPVLRCVLSTILCGERRRLREQDAGGWNAHLARCETEIAQALPEAERLRVAIAVENHQDADSADLLALCRRFESRYFGVTLDAGNPLAVAEEPLTFARRLAPYLRHAHFKDYRVHAAPAGYRLVRCALGEGVIDFPALLQLFEGQEWPITASIELAALHSRLIPVLDTAWWEEFAPRDAREFVPALKLVWENLRPEDEEWRTPLELDASGEDLAAYEQRQLSDSIAYLRRIGAVSE